MPPPQSPAAPPAGTALATLAGGCFWCLDAVFRPLRGIHASVAGYTGGQHNPLGPAEALQLTFDPAAITYRDLLHVFFTLHDPTTLNRQGADIGPEYRSAIFYHSPEQLAAAQAVMAELTAAALWPRPFVTELAPAEPFHVAESYHQNYFANHPDQGYCQIVIAPKVAQLRQHYLALLAHP
jgi:peptide-methionine (S)-S-oxide reductase